MTTVKILGNGKFRLTGEPVAAQDTRFYVKAWGQTGHIAFCYHYHDAEQAQKVYDEKSDTRHYANFIYSRMECGVLDPNGSYSPLFTWKGPNDDEILRELTASK